MADPTSTHESGEKPMSDDGKGGDSEAEGKASKHGGRYSFSKVCPHKAFPKQLVDRKQFKTQKEYVEFLMKNSLEQYPWYQSTRPIHKRTLKPKQPPDPDSPGLQKVRRLELKATPPEDIPEDFELDKYIVLEKEKVKKKKKKKAPKVSTMDYEIKVNKELEFLLSVMADAKEVLVQKAIDFEREKEELERQGQKNGDIIVLQNIVQGMMFKVMDEHEEDIMKKEKEKEECLKKLKAQKLREEFSECQCPPVKKCPKKKKKKKHLKKKIKDPCDPCAKTEEFDPEKAYENEICVQKQKKKEQTTKELVTFLKELFEQQEMKKEVVKEEKAVSPYASEKELETIIYNDVTDEFLEEEFEEEEEEEEEEFEGEFVVNKDAEGYIDMNEVKKRLEELQNEEGVEEEYEDEDNDFLEGEFNEFIDEETSETPLTKDASAQFNYCLERKKIIPKEPKNITEDLALFMKVVIMGDDNLREIMREKELLEFKRKQIDFMTMGMLLKKPEPCQCILMKMKKKGWKGKCRCCDKKKCERKHLDCEEENDMTYNIRPIEFMLMLQVLMNTLEVIYEQDQLLKEPSVVSAESAATVTFIPEEHFMEEEEEEDIAADVDDDDDD